jgi:hypothetical protein
MNQPQQPSDMELLLMLARESFARYGTALPPIGSFAAKPVAAPITAQPAVAVAPAIAPQRKPRQKRTEQPQAKTPAGETDWTNVFHTCPKCKHHGPVLPDFGLRPVRGIVRKQSWCHNCRATTNYYKKPVVQKRWSR